MKAQPVLVKTLEHRERGQEGQRLGHVAYVQRRAPAKMRRFGGRRWASWARRTVDGVPTGTPERFETYDTETEAVSHAVYAAGKSTPTCLELVRFGGRLP
jgi:hypothetical protein